MNTQSLLPTIIQSISAISGEKNEIVDPKSYAKFLEYITNDIKESQLRAAMSITKELTALYWRIGKMLLEKISGEGWGAKTINKLAKDLESSFPDTDGFSLRNLQYMRKFAKSYPDSNCATAVARFFMIWDLHVMYFALLPLPI